MRHLKPSITLLTLAFCTLQIQPIIACSCLPDPPSLEANVEFADLVFAGTVVQLSHDDYSDGEVTFQISRVWKGQITKTVVFPIFWGSSCQYAFSQGQSYLVYANWAERPDINKGKSWFHPSPNRVLAVDICGRTSVLNGTPDPLGNSDIADLGAGYAPLPNKADVNWVHYVAFCLFNLGLLKAGIYIIKRRKRLKLEHLS